MVGLPSILGSGADGGREDSRSSVADGATGSGKPRYKAFISYSRADSRLAAAIGKGLEQLAKPIQKRRVFDVYLDLEEVAAGGLLPDKLVAGLDNSEFLVVIASHSSAASTWVDREVAHWLARHGTDSILIVLAEGELVWNSGDADFAPSAADVLPAPLLGSFVDPPVWIDLREEASLARTDSPMADNRLSLDNAEFKLKIAALQAPLRGPDVVPSDIVGEDLNLWRRGRRVRRGAVISLVLLVAIVLFVGWRFLQSQAANRVERADRTAAEAGDVFEAAPDVGLAMYLESLSIEDLDRNRVALFGALESAPGPIRVVAAADQIEGAAVRPGGGWLTLEPRTGTLLLWDEGGNPDGTIDFDREGFGPRLLRGSSTIAVAAVPAGEAVAVIDLTAEEVSYLEWPGASISAIGLSQDGKRIAAGDDAGLIRVWDRGGEFVEIDTRPHLGCVGDQLCPVVALTFDALSGDLASGNLNCVAVWIVDQMRPRWFDCDLVFIPKALASVDDEIVYASGGDAIFVKAVDGSTGRRPLVGFASDADVAGIEISPGGDLAATVREDGSATVWEISGAPQPRAVLSIRSDVRFASPTLAIDDTPRLAVSLPDGRFVVWNASERSTLAVPVMDDVRGVDVSSGEVIAIAGDGRVTAISSAAAIERAEPCSGATSDPAILSFASGDTPEVYVAGFADGSIRVVAPGGSSCFVLDEAAGSVGVSTDGSLVVAGTHGAVFAWRPGMDAAEQVATDPDRRALHAPVAVTADGLHIAYGRSNGSIVLVSGETFEELDVIELAHRVDVDSLTFSLDGGLLASGSDDREVAVWDVANSSEVHRLRGHVERVRFVAFSANGERLASAAEDGIVLVWDLSTGSSGSAPMHHLTIPRGVALTTDTLYVADGDELVAWALDPSSWPDSACEIVLPALTADPDRFSQREVVVDFCAGQMP